MASATSIGGLKGSFYNTFHIVAHGISANAVTFIVDRLAVAILGNSDNAKYFAKTLAFLAGLATSIYLVPQLLPTADLVSFTGMQAIGWALGLNVLVVTAPIAEGALAGYFGAPFLYLAGAVGAFKAL